MEYKSELTCFLNELKQNDPRLEAQQRKGHARGRDTLFNLEERQRAQFAKAAQPAYVYYQNF